MWKIALAGLAALSIFGVNLALAQQSPQANAPRWQFSAEDRAALADARIAALRAGLRLSPEQEKHWPAVEAAIRDLAKQRGDRIDARRSAMGRDNAAPRTDLIERLRRGAATMAERSAALKKLADAAEPLYGTLDESQKQRLTLLMRMGRQGPHWHRRG